MPETIQQLSPAEQAVSYLLTDLGYRLGQGVLFDDPSIKALFRRDLQAEHPDMLVISGELMDHYRYWAACMGAGYDMDELEPHSHNKMWDEVAHNNFATQVVEAEHDLSADAYVVSPEALAELLTFDYENLRDMRDEGFDLLYKKED